MAVTATLTLDLSSFGHGVFGFQNSATSLKNDGQLSKRERVMRCQHGHSSRMLDRFFGLAVFLKMNSQCQMSLNMVGVGYQNLPERLDGPGQVTGFFQFIGGIVQRISTRICG